MSTVLEDVVIKVKRPIKTYMRFTEKPEITNVMYAGYLDLKECLESNNKGIVYEVLQSDLIVVK